MLKTVTNDPSLLTSLSIFCSSGRAESSLCHGGVLLAAAIFNSISGERRTIASVKGIGILQCEATSLQYTNLPNKIASSLISMTFRPCFFLSFGILILVYVGYLPVVSVDYKCSQQAISQFDRTP